MTPPSALSVRCPVCRAWPTFPCLSVDGGPLSWIHGARTDEAASGRRGPINPLTGRPNR